MRTALVHDWLIHRGGAEKTLEEIWQLYPSPIYALFKKGDWSGKTVHTSVLQNIPGATRIYRDLLPLFPWAVERFDLSDFDLVISSSHSAAKGVLTHEGQLHLCYCYTPMRYAWDMRDFYAQQMGRLKALAAKPWLSYLRRWDVANSKRVDHFIAISHSVAQRIKNIYGREATVIYPPVATHLFEPRAQKEEFYLTVSRLVPYKKIDLIVDAFAHLSDKRLVIVGDGPELAKIKAKAGRNIEILGQQTDERVRDLMHLAKAFIFAAEEEFGIVVVEAQAAGTPVIAFGAGGVLETVIENETGCFFHEQSVASLIDAVHRFEQKAFDSAKIGKNALKFSVSRFKSEFQQFVEQKKNEFYANSNSGRRERKPSLAPL